MVYVSGHGVKKGVFILQCLFIVIVDPTNAVHTQS
jgi:hypothetical protein